MKKQKLINLLNNITMEGNIGLDAKMIKSSKTILNNLLADHFVLLAKTWNFQLEYEGAEF